MALNLDFNNIRSLGSSNDGFEEMVCQLAHRMEVPNRKHFVRNGRPDGGVECYWELGGSEIWIWQAKFFPNSLGVSQFNQIDKSVTTAFKLHKNIKKFYIALPLDLPDDGKVKTRSARKRYEEKVAKWQKIKGAEGTEFILWGKHEILTLLSKKENEGMVRFWFSKEEFTRQDFDNQNRKAIDALGSRYTPELNVELDISMAFDGLSRNARFEGRLKEHLAKFRKAWEHINTTDEDRKTDEHKRLQVAVSNIIERSRDLVFDGIDTIPLDNLGRDVSNLEELVQAFIQYLENKDPKPDYKLWEVREFQHECSRLIDYLDDPECHAVNVPILLVKGDAGVGKSHLLADVVENRLKEGCYSLFFLGQHFNSSEDPWTQIFRQLKFTGKEEEFLQALEAKAETSGSRIVIFIDALNEGGGRILWHKYIKPFVNQIKKYPWLGLVVSIRSTYISAIFGNNWQSEYTVLTHKGFEGKSFEAVKLFFKNSNIPLPSVPLLLPEFKNPLFLKIFCDGLQKNGLTKIDEGRLSIVSVFKLFIEGIEKELSSPEKKDYLPELHLVQRAIDKLIDYQVESLSTEVPLDKAIELTDSVRTSKFSEGELLSELISYGVLTRNMRYLGDGEFGEVVYLAYDRFNDFLTAQRLLDKEDEADKAIKTLIQDKRDLWYYDGILEALAIIIPERTGRELYEILPDWKNTEFVFNSVMKSLLWRKKSTIDKKLVDYFNNRMTEPQFWDFISILIQVGPKVDHYFNAEFLHRNLMRWKMAERDYRWSIVLHYLSGDKDNAVETLITWAKEDFGEVVIDSETKYLIAIVLVWFTSCMDRRIRDNASKGLINLVRNDIGLMIKLIEKFEHVDDPYVMERLYAAAYGCALLSKKTDKLPALSLSVYKHIFDVDGEVYPDAMVRDYARGVIEFTLVNHPDLRLGDKPIAPPYNSAFTHDYPTDEETKAYSKKDKDGKWITPGIDLILASMVTEHGYSLYGDFGRYVFQRRLDGWAIDPQKLSNLAVKWIMERYGYDEKLFGGYDKSIDNGRMRMVYPGERVGKKYQWIALHEMVARLSDNVPMRDSWTDKEEHYGGTWLPYLRDFDPTMRVNEQMKAWNEDESKYWWNSLEFSEWDTDKAGWARRYDKLPSPNMVIESVDGLGDHWIALYAMPEWKEPHEKNEIYCNLWYHIRGYVIEEDKFDDIWRWAEGRNFLGRWMPEVSDRYEMYEREYYWSPAYRYFEGDGLIKREIYEKGEKIMDVELPCVQYLWESEYDYSKPGIISYLKPSRQLFEGMGMRYSDRDGELVDSEGKLLCFDTRVNYNSNRYFLVRKDALLQYLRTSHKMIMWVIIGEKNLSGRMIPHGNWLDISGAYYLDNSGNVVGNISTYLDGKVVRGSTKNSVDE